MSPIFISENCCGISVKTIWVFVEVHWNDIGQSKVY